MHTELPLQNLNLLYILKIKLSSDSFFYTFSYTSLEQINLSLGIPFQGNWQRILKA